ncbi:MAG: DNA cytosine methyltransferase [Rubripirellula sp.]
MSDVPTHASDRNRVRLDSASGNVRIVDLFCGIGGVAEATQGWTRWFPNTLAHPSVVTAIDIDRRIGPVYEANHGIRPLVRAIESLDDFSGHTLSESVESGASLTDSLAKGSVQTELAEMWWMSPPCQPYTERGTQRGEADSRSAGFARILALLERNTPEFIGLENVPAFEGSLHHRQLCQILATSGYGVHGFQLCPTDWGVPMRRRRYYLLARRDGTPPKDLRISSVGRCLSDYLDPRGWEDDTLLVNRDTVSRYGQAMSLIEADDSAAIASCFTSAYGNSPVRAGSYLHCHERNLVRRFSPNEIALLMGFRPGFQWTPDLSQRAKYRLLGNSLAVMVIRDLLRALFESRRG